MLHCGNELPIEGYSFCFKFGDAVSKKDRIISSSFFVAVKYTGFGI